MANNGIRARGLGVGLLLGALLFLLPLPWVGEGWSAPSTRSPSPPAPVSAPPTESGVKDGSFTLTLLRADGTTGALTMADYLFGVVAAEMPAGFEPAALSAQAVCARTYTLYIMEAGKHREEGADVCASSSCCQAYTTPAAAREKWGAAADSYAAKVTAAIAATDGMVAIYNGAPIQAVFFSSSAPRTEDAVEVWGNSCPYLVPVDSPEGEEVPDYTTVVTLTADQLRERVLAVYPQAVLEGDSGGWLGEAAYTASGRVASLPVGGVTLTGREARALFSLRSACFTVSHDEQGFTFTVTGYGHGVGLSQYGANAMARAGADWREIVTHYYTGVALSPVEELRVEKDGGAAASGDTQ